MNRPTSYSDDIKPLLNSPSVPLWEAEIEKVLLGKRDHMIVRHEGVQGYIEVLWAQSSNEALAERTFRRTLREIMRNWRPSRPAPEYYLAVLMDLISAYNPPLGFIKVLGYIRRRGRFGKNAIERKTGVDLHLKALTALQHYFPTPPAFADDAPGFNPYVEMLREHLKDLSYSGHAVRRLVELEVLQPNDQEVADAIRQNVETLRELIPVLLAQSRRSRAARDLALIYYQGLATGENVDQIFIRASRAYRGRFEPLVPEPIIVFENGEVIRFHFTAEEMEKHSHLHDQTARVSEIAGLIRDTQKVSEAEEKAGELAVILEEMLDKGDEGDIGRFVKAVGRSGIYFAPGAAGPELYVPHGVIMPLRLHRNALNKYMLRVRFGEEPGQAVQTFVRNVRTKAATK